ncbi:unnamed protein product [Lymnaea stagnalis]|uniref:Complex I assembly factor TIMMDC1, mitochondrial n=1 Tax=Lymnaea stagnalis TaxID=6523 RepID=A0AAV2HCJ5_LYMST
MKLITSLIASFILQKVAKIKMSVEDSNVRCQSSSRLCHWLITNSNCSRQIIFPYHSYSGHGKKCQDTSTSQRQCLPHLFSSLFCFSKVYASDVKPKTDDTFLNKDENLVQDPSVSTNTERDLTSLNLNYQELEILARAYIEKESGMERIYMIFRRDHKGHKSTELQVIHVALIQTMVVCFFLKYIPAWKMAKDTFIQEHQTTVFRTRLEALRRLQDQVSYKASMAGGRFAAKVTFFSASFLFLSQMIAAYRNKTSVLEYTIAAGITGGLSRISFGVKGFISGSVIGATLGTFLGGVVCLVCKSLGITNDIRHLDAVMAKLAVEKSIVGEEQFKAKLQELTKNHVFETQAVS